MKTIGLKWDQYTPAVEGQITRDLLALQSNFGAITVICDGTEVDSLLSALGLYHGVGSELANTWILYQTKAERVEHPENAENVIERDLYVAVSDTQLDSGPKPGYYLKPQGRIGRPRLSQLPIPTHNGTTDPMVILLWG